MNNTLIVLLEVILAGLVAGVITLRAIPTVNHIARAKGLLNVPGERTSHRYKTPNLAGVSIFLASCVGSLLFIHDDLATFQYIYLASIIIFFTGLKDDILLISPWRKLLSQIAVAFLITLTDLRFTHIFSFLGFDVLGPITSTIITIIFIVGIINAVNLIDGIDGLAAAIGMLILGCFGLFFFINGLCSWAIYCASMIGALGAFFQYNVFGLRNKTFMGDSGSLLLGLSVAVTTIMFWESNANPSLLLTFPAAPAITFAIIIVPLFDTARVFIYRIIRHISPFVADRNHLHHRLIDIGLSHLQATIVLTAFNLLMVIVAIGLSFFIGMIWITLILLALMLLFVALVNKRFKEKIKTKTSE